MITLVLSSFSSHFFPFVSILPDFFISHDLYFPSSSLLHFLLFSSVEINDYSVNPIYIFFIYFSFCFIPPQSITTQSTYIFFISFFLMFYATAIYYYSINLLITYPKKLYIYIYILLFYFTVNQLLSIKP